MFLVSYVVAIRETAKQESLSCVWIRYNLAFRSIRWETVGEDLFPCKSGRIEYECVRKIGEAIHIALQNGGEIGVIATENDRSVQLGILS